MTRPPARRRARAAGQAGHKAGPRRRRRQPETELQIAVIEYLRMALPDAITLHCPNGGKRSLVEAKIMKAMGVLAGASDILVCWGTHFPAHGSGVKVPAGSLWIELKAGKGKLSKAQEAFRDDCRAKRIHWAEARNLEDVERACRAAGLRPRASVGGAGRAVRDLPGSGLGPLAGAPGPGRRREPEGGLDVPEVPAALIDRRAGIMGSSAEACEHGVPYRWACEKCDEKYLHDPEEGQNKGRV